MKNNSQFNTAQRKETSLWLGLIARLLIPHPGRLVGKPDQRSLARSAACLYLLFQFNNSSSENM